MKKITLSIIALFLINILFAQNSTQREVLPLQMTLVGEYWQTQTMDVPLEHNGPFLTYYAKSSEQVADLSVRFSIDGTTWQAWQVMKPETHQEFEDDSWISEMAFLEKGEQYFQISAGAAYSNLSVHFYNPGHTKETDDRLTVQPENTDRSCPCPQPAFQTRSQWCPAGDCYPHPNPSGTVPTHLIIHHSATSNTASDWAAVVRSFWDFHVNGNGWSDIGYNWLIDPNGVVYEGRGDNILGAHFCGTNGGTVGTCVIGNFTDALPTETAVSKLVELYAWKACNRNLDPLGSGYHNSSGLTLNRISGHRDGCSTACPGDMFYPTIPTIRQRIFDHIVGGCDGLAGATGLQGSLTGETEATLNWEDNSDEELGFLLERGQGSDPDFLLYATIDADITEYIDEDVQMSVLYTYRIRSYTATDTSSYSNEAVVSGAVATEDLFFNTKTVLLYPNPVSDKLQVKLDNQLSGSIEIEVLNPISKKIKQAFVIQKSTAEESFELDFNHLPAGIYLLRIGQKGHSGLFKVVVQ